MFHVEQQTSKIFDIAVIGAGHAGVEAVAIAAKLNLEICLITIKGVGIASAPCSPAVGGVGKGQIVREIDALGGIMGELVDQSAIHYRTLNDSKGYAVRSTRAQIDKDLYSQNAENLIKRLKNVKLILDLVISINRTPEAKFEIITQDSRQIIARKVIITTGTFLDGKIHLGDQVTAGGRYLATNSPSMGQIFTNMAKKSRRFKTGTPPRIASSSIDFSQLKRQGSDASTRNFHLLNRVTVRQLPQKICFLAHTTPAAMKIIRDNYHKSPVFTGQITGVGPRYCPSIEDKAARYPDRDIHHFFVGPEELRAETYYPSGLSTSLPLEIQQQFIRTIPGFEQAEIKVPGHAVEYEVIDAAKLNSSLEYSYFAGLYFAGQVNGTSGYEEAAAQGLIAGINAAFSLLKRPSFIMDRRDSYIGVLIEDIVTNLRDEPYRLFTARAENRLSIREDNTFLRMYPYRKRLKLDEKLDHLLASSIYQYELLQELVKKQLYRPGHSNSSHFRQQNYSDIPHNGIFLADLLKKSHVDPVAVLNSELIQLQVQFCPDVVSAVAVQQKYEGYVAKAEANNKNLDRLNKRSINWHKLVKSNNISFECKQRIDRIRPATFGQLRNIEGIRPATLAAVAARLS